MRGKRYTSLSIKLAIVDTKLHASVILLHKHNWGDQRTIRRLDDILLEHVLEQLTYVPPPTDVVLGI